MVTTAVVAWGPGRGTAGGEEGADLGDLLVVWAEERMGRGAGFRLVTRPSGRDMLALSGGETQSHHVSPRRTNRVCVNCPHLLETPWSSGPWRAASSQQATCSP